MVGRCRELPPITYHLPPMKAPHVVIVGAGFGGLTAARALARAPVRVTVVDRRNHHLFQPLLYQVATAALSPGDIAYPIRSILRHQANATVLLADVLQVEPEARRLVLDEGSLNYDYLIAATEPAILLGTMKGKPSRPGLKPEDAIEIRGRILLVERAERRRMRESARTLTFVLVGGGPTERSWPAR